MNAECRWLPVHPGSVVAALLAVLLPDAATAQITPSEASQLRTAIGDRIEALTILGGDFGIAAANFRSTGRFSSGESTDATLTVTKLGGAGDIGDAQPLASLPVGWQPHVQGNMGALDGTQHLHSELVEGDITRIKAYGIEFGGGARFWVNGRLSFAPTVVGLYGHMSQNYTANSTFMRANLEAARQLGLIDWNVDTWTFITGVDIQYRLTWDRTILTLSSNPVYYHTESFQASNAHVAVNGNSQTWANIIDVDIPIGLQVYGHELRTGGYYRWTGLYGSVSEGLHEPNLSELHARVVLDFLGQLWKVQWIGIGGSYVWGGHITGWTLGADAVFRF